MENDDGDDAFELGLAIPGEGAVAPAELLVVLPGLAVVDLEGVGVGEVDAWIGERSCEFSEAVGGKFVVVVDLDQDIASARLAREPLQFADVLRLPRVGDDSGLREVDLDLARVAVGDDDPFEVGECLVRD